jgi:hypothetical protein
MYGFKIRYSYNSSSNHRISSIALTYQKESSWINHSIAGIAGMTLKVVVIVYGGILAERIKRRRDNIFKLH